MRILLGLLTLVFLALLGLLALSSLWAAIVSLSPTILAPLLIASGTVISVTITVVVGQFLQRRAAHEEAQRSRKVEIYERFMERWFGFLELGISEEKRTGAVTESAEAIAYMAEFSRQVILWGSDTVVRDYSRFTGRTRGPVLPGSVEPMLEFERVLFAMRRDLGHTNRGVKPPDLLRLFITDIDEALATQKAKDRNA
jgi:hypothetical protein